MNTTDATRATAEAMPADKPDLLDIADIIHRARLLVSCICMASASLRGNERDAISIVGDAAVDKLVEARNALEAMCEAGREVEPRVVVNVGHVLSEMLDAHAEITASINRTEGDPDAPDTVALCERQCRNAMAIISYRPLTKEDGRRKAEFLREWTDGSLLSEEEQGALIASMLPEGGAA